MDVEVDTVLDHLGVRQDVEPDARPGAIRANDAIRTDSQLTQVTTAP
ncbi:MAG TPA: hypothetical protein VMI73_25295 [Trebonia sp.]|nr:hypothetical protein [Trebonia sp.]